MTQINQPLAGKVALVTGTMHGIGAAIAVALANDGATVHGIDIDTVDVTDSRGVNEFVASIGGADILVNSAGGVRGQVGKPLEEVTDEQWRDVVESNLTGTFISSGAGRSVSLTGIQAYASAKAAQIGFTRQMAHELGPHGITVNCVAPGFVLSNPTSIAQWESYGEEGQAQLLSRIPTRRLGEAEDIANGVSFFVNPASSWISGQTLSIDGGHALY
jgi:3-oxoacyl-[acyl-carrier protein] reductase